MIKINRYLGFTDNIKEPRKTKVENLLSKPTGFDNIFYNSTAEALCNKLLEGFYPEKEENVWYYKRNGERNKPKTQYRLMVTNGQFFEMNKTQYDFVCYLINKGLDTEEKILAYDKEDKERAEVLKQAEENERKRQEQLEQQKELEKENFEQWLKVEAEKVPDEQKEIIDNIFIDKYGYTAVSNYTLAVCINNYDNDKCKAEVKSRLDNNNKGSIKVFEHLTGLILPKGYKERFAYLDKLTKTDFKGIIPYKRKETSTKEKNTDGTTRKRTETFYINRRTGYGDSTEWAEVKATPVNKYDIEMFIFKDGTQWNLSHAQSGYRICGGKTKKETLETFEKTIQRQGIDKVKQAFENAEERAYNSTGVNPRYKAI